MSAFVESRRPLLAAALAALLALAGSAGLAGAQEATPSGGAPLGGAASSADATTAAGAAGADSAEAPDDGRAGPAFLSASLEDLSLRLPRAASARVAVVLDRNGATVAREDRDVALHDGQASLKGMTASVETEDGNLTAHRLRVQVLVDGQVALAVGGALGAQSAEGRFRVSELAWPPDSPVAPTGPGLVTFQSGWSSDRLTLAFAPLAGARLANATILFQADRVQGGAAAALVARAEQPVERSPQGNVFATFELDHLPPVLAWRASLRASGQERAAAWAEVNFPLASGRGFSYDPGSPPAVEAVGAFHDVEDRKDTVTVPSSVLLSGDQDLTRCLRPAPTFTSTQGQASGRLDEFREERGAQPTAGCGFGQTDEGPEPGPGGTGGSGCNATEGATGASDAGCGLNVTSVDSPPPPPPPPPTWSVRDILPYAFVAVVVLLAAVAWMGRRGVR